VVVFASVGITLWFTAGCVLFPEWWFGFIWGGQFTWQTVTEGLKVLLDEYFSLLISILVAVCIVIVLSIAFKVRLFRFVDRFAGHILFVALALLFATALIDYHIQHIPYELNHTMQVDLMTLDNIQRFLAASNEPPHVASPIDFQYIDKERINALFNQIEPDLVEKERTVSTTGSLKGKVGVAVTGVLSAEAESGKGVASTSSFARASFSSERKCIELMNYLVDHGNPKYYTSSEQWVLGKENAALALEMERNKHEPIDLSKLHPITPVLDNSSDTSADDKPTEEQKRNAENKAKQYQLDLQDELKSLRGYVFVDGEFSKTTDGDALTLVETFSTKPRKVLFRVRVPISQMPILQKQSRLRLKVFGDVISPLSGDGYLDIRPIAAY
jgi:hypothetical protein